jgi:hypothetical protein
MYKLKIFLTSAVFILTMFAAQAQQAPGGLSNYTYQVWLTPDSYTPGVWTNLANSTTGNFTQPSTWTTKSTPVAAVGSNFQYAVGFRAPDLATATNRMQSAGSIGITTADAYTIILVYKANSGTWDWRNILNFATTGNYYIQYNALGYNTPSSSTLSMGWNSTLRNLGDVPFGTNAIVTVDNDNSANIYKYLNGDTNNPSTSASSNSSSNNLIILGASSYDLTGNGERGVDADIQEVIILKHAGLALMPVNDLLKIHSYLAVKYGITLPIGDYVNSAGTAVWSRSFNGGYTSNIFGIGRDNASRLNQVQSVSQNDNGLTVYVGTLGATNNNSSTALNDKDFVMFGSSGLQGNHEYQYPAGTAFANGSITNKINSYTNSVWKAQVTLAGVKGGSQTVNMKLTNPFASYILVSQNSSFLPGTTSLYTVSSLTAMGVVINDGDYITEAGYQPTPGGSSSNDVLFSIWLTPDSYSNGVWKNNIAGTSGDFVQPSSWTNKTAPAVAVGANFQNAVQFRASDYNVSPNRMQEEKGINLGTNDAFTFLIVYKAYAPTVTSFNNQNILCFGPENEYQVKNFALGYTTRNANPNLVMAWPGAATLTQATAQSGTTYQRSLAPVPWNTLSLVTVDNNNLNEIRHYLNSGSARSFSMTNGSGSTNVQMILGGANQPNAATPAGVGLAMNGSQGINADIQELIMLRRSNKTTAPFLASLNGGNDLIKMQTYLALKYGITLAGSNYMATDDKVVWDSVANMGYNRNIIGIARDDETGLYQKQSVSSTFSGTTIYIGDKLQTLNSDNTGTLNDMQYLVLGSNGLTTITPLATPIADGAVYGNGNIVASNGLNYESSAIYLAQLTNLATMTFNIKTSADYLYAFVSSTSTFDPANTKIYPFANKTAKITVDATYKYIRFAGFTTGPGGVSPVTLWLHADDESSLVLENADATSDSRLNGYDYTHGGTSTSTIVPAVSSWTDQMRGHTYSYAASGGTPAQEAVHRIPVYSPDNLKMNFHPSVEFWGGSPGALGTTYGSYLTNPNGVLTAAGLPPNGHTTYIVTSNQFNTADWVYPLMFQTDKVLPVASDAANGYTDYAGPGYGMQKYSIATTGNYILPAYRGNLVGRFRTSAWQGAGSVNLFTEGATSISGYYQSGNQLSFRFNGRVDSVNVNPDGLANGVTNDVADPNTIVNGNFNMSSASTLGTGARLDRTLRGVMSEVIIYDRVLNADEQRKVESYLAIKYGATLRPSNTATQRFNYTLSNDTVFWRGDIDSTDVTNGKYAKFYNNVAAVIRDDAAKLYNPQSHSTDAGSILHMGLAGKSLGTTYDLGSMNDQEVVVWGANDQKGVLQIPETVVDPMSCAQFKNIFKKKWMVRKITQGDRPITMLVGAENNAGNTLGQAISTDDTDFAAMYTALSTGNTVTMLVADDPAKLEYGNPQYGDFLALVPMTYMNGELQCSYTIPGNQKVFYVTFGFKPNPNGCYSETTFSGALTYNWNVDYPRRDNKLNDPSTYNTARKVPATPVDYSLGGYGITAKTQVTYGPGVRASTYYPRFTSTPLNGLEIERINGTPNDSYVTTTMSFSSSIIPTFSISDLDNYSAQQDVVEIKGFCNGIPATPVLMYTGQASAATYTIQGARAVTKTTAPTVENTDPRGTVMVTFKNGVDSVVVIYTVASRKPLTSTAKYITISRISISSNVPPPLFNEDGLAFTKTVQDNSISTCEPVLYKFTVKNINDKNKYVSFNDVLPDKMTWGSITLDTLNAINPSVKVNSFGSRTLTIDSLLVPCGNDIMFMATAAMDSDAQSGTYANSAEISYEQLVNSTMKMKSQDAQSLDSLTMLYVSWEERYDTLQLTTTVEPVKYSEGKELLVTLDVFNPNQTPDITDVFLNVSWDAGFTYVPNSWSGGASSYVFADDSDSTHLSIAGMTSTSDPQDGSKGFILTDGHSIFTFKIKAPVKDNLVEVLDANENPIAGEIAPVQIAYDFYSTMQDPCIIGSMNKLSGVSTVQYSGGRSFIIVNKHITSPSSFLQLK